MVERQAFRLAIGLLCGWLLSAIAAQIICDAPPLRYLFSLQFFLIGGVVILVLGRKGRSVGWRCPGGLRFSAFLEIMKM